MAPILSPVEVMTPAPGEELHPSLALANSSGRQDDPETSDLLSTAERTTQWMIEHGLAKTDVAVYEHCSSRLRHFRAAVRNVLGAAAAAAGTAPEEQAVAVVNDALTRIPSVTLLGWDQSTGFHGQQKYAEIRAVEHALSVIAADLVSLVTSEEAGTLAQCAAPSCGRFLLRTHSRRQWCSTRCGDRVRAARAYAKKTSHQHPE